MARIVAAFGTSHSTMLFSSAEHWQALFDHVDCKAPINDLEGVPRSYDELLKTTPPAAAANLAKDVLAKRHAETEAATLMTLLIPVILFILFQRYFVRGVVVTTGLDK